MEEKLFKETAYILYDFFYQANISGQGVAGEKLH